MTKSSKRRKVGSIRKLPSGRYWARVTVGTKVDGSQRTVTKTHDTEQEAESWILSKLVELNNQTKIENGITVRQLWSAYKIDRKDVLSKKTLESYTWYMEGAKKGTVGCWLDWIGDKDASIITPAMIQVRINDMPHTKAKHAKNSISSVFSWAVRKDLIPKNPLRGHIFEYPSKPNEQDIFNDDPFAAIEQTRNVWGIEVALKCFKLSHGLPLEAAWLACIGAGLRIEEALAIRKIDVRRINIEGRMITQLAVHSARTNTDSRKTTKTPQSRRIVAMLEPFGKRYWDICQSIKDKHDLVCPVSAQNQNKRWRGYFDNPSTSKHAPRKDGWNYRGRLHELPYLPLSKMRNTHVTIMAEAGVSDSINALIHGHTEMIERKHYLSPDATKATIHVSDRFKLVV